MAEIFSSGRAIDWIMAFVILEAFALLALRAFCVNAPSLLSSLANVAAGGFLLLALRFALSGAGGGPVAASLAAAFVAHLADLAGRWKDVAVSAPRLTEIALATPRFRAERHPHPKRRIRRDAPIARQNAQQM